MSDYLRTGKYFSKLVNPPKLPEKEEIELFSEGLAEVCNEKISDLMFEHSKLEFYKEIMDSRIEEAAKNKVFKNDFDEYFTTYFVMLRYSEVDYIQKWLDYWLRLYEICTKKVVRQPVFIEKDTVTDIDIQRAKDYPLESLYNGDLRHVAGRLTGVCPFHEERTPSFFIYDDNHYYCFGCNAWGDAIDFYMKTNNVNMIEAVKALNAR